MSKVLDESLKDAGTTDGEFLAFELGESEEQRYLRSKEPPREKESGSVVRIADLFCGAGGLSLGAQEACREVGKRFRSVLAIDKHESSLTVYSGNFNPDITCGEVCEVVNGRFEKDLTSQEEELVATVGSVDLVLAGPPCQGHSNLNNHTRRDDERNSLYERVGRFAEIADPENLLVENVPDVVHGKGGSFERTATFLGSEMGYNVDSKVVDLSRIGIPQSRKRHILIATRRGEVEIDSVIDQYETASERTVRWAISDLEGAEQEGDPFNRPSNHNDTNRNRIDWLHDNDKYDLPDELRPACHRGGGHSYKSMYGRMRYDEPAQTITSGYGSPGQGRFIHPNRRRTLTPHEAARLQFFPDFFDFSSVEKRTDLAFMIGNAVPMKLSYILCLQFLE